MLPRPAPTTRFAPSPTGYLHLGHAFAAATAWRLARHSGGRFLLRIEDIDPQRCRPEFTDAILEDLAWLGLDWDGEVRVQSRHLSQYGALLHDLVERELVYPCFCTRADISREIAAAATAPHGPDGPIYPGTCRRLPSDVRAARMSNGTRFAWRLNVAAACAAVPRPLSYRDEELGRIVCRPDRFGDIVLGRKDVPASYHLCATCDDAVQGVTLVSRGDDLRPFADLHRLLQALFQWSEPHYVHHPLLCGPDGKRLAKRGAAPTLRAIRKDGHSPGVVWREIRITPG